MPRKRRNFIISATTSRGARNLENFIRLLKKKGIDLSTTDLARYDFDSFETLDDLLRHYAFRERDPICQKLLRRDEDEELNAWQSQYEQYLNYMANQVQDEDGEDEANPLEDLAHKVLMIEQAIDGLRSKIERLETLTSITDTVSDIKRQILELKKSEADGEALKKLEAKLEKLESKLEDLKENLKAKESEAPMPLAQPVQLTLEGAPEKPIAEKAKAKKAPSPYVKLLSGLKTLVIFGTMAAAFKYWHPYDLASGIMALAFVVLALVSDIVISVGVIGVFRGRTQASPNGYLWSHGRRFNMRR